MNVWMYNMKNSLESHICICKWIDSVFISLPVYMLLPENKLEYSPTNWMGLNAQCCTQYDQTRYPISWYFSCHSSFALEWISVRILLHYKLLNYSVEGLKTRLAKRPPINKTLRNQITLAILSRSCHSSWRQVWISVAFASPQEAE